MKTRCVFTTNDIYTARAAMEAAHQAGVDDNDIALLARSDIEQAQIPDHLLRGRNDFYAGALRGMLWGGGTGLLLGFIATMVSASFQFPLSGALFTCAIGAIIGCWISALVGSGVPDPVDRKFKSEIDSGHILVVVDTPRDNLAQVEPAVARTGAVELPFHLRTILC
ncbi:MAG: hypothetical protein WA777_18955 [Rhodanobacter sp.]